MRIFWIKLFFLLFFLAISGRLFYWQLVQAQYLQAQAEKQYFADVKVEALRGKIFFGDGDIMVASNATCSVFGQPKLISKDKISYESYTLAKLLISDGEDEDSLAKDFINKLSQDLFWVQLQKNISFEKK